MGEKEGEVSVDQLREFRAAFGMFDKDGDGTITVKELREVMKELGQKPTDKEIQKILKEVDLNGNGTIEFSEFVVMMANQLKKPEKEKQYTIAFQAFDKDNSGYISKEELKEGLKKLGIELSDAELAAKMKECDENEDNQISYEEFVKLISSI